MTEERPVLNGFMVLEGWADDYSDWEGVITGPKNPRGANRYWEDPIPMIETRAYDHIQAKLAASQARVKRLEEALKAHSAECMINNCRSCRRNTEALQEDKG